MDFQRRRSFSKMMHGRKIFANYRRRIRTEKNTAPLRRNKEIHDVHHGRVIRFARTSTLLRIGHEEKVEKKEEKNCLTMSEGVAYETRKGSLPGDVIDDPTQDIGPLFPARYFYFLVEILFVVARVSHAALRRRILPSF